MLTVKGEEVDRVVGLELGADDYLAKLRQLSNCLQILYNPPNTILSIQLLVKVEEVR